MPFEAALAAIGWHGKVHKSVLEIEEIDVDKMTDRVRRQLEALAPFVRDGGLVRFEDADSDGFVACEDCDDSDADINPDGVELIGDAVDSNCDDI